MPTGRELLDGYETPCYAVISRSSASFTAFCGCCGGVGCCAPSSACRLAGSGGSCRAACCGWFGGLPCVRGGLRSLGSSYGRLRRRRLGAGLSCFGTVQVLRPLKGRANRKKGPFYSDSGRRAALL